MRSLAVVVLSCAVGAVIMSCSETVAPVIPPAPTVALTIKTVTPISVTVQIVADSASVSDTDRFILLRGSTAASLLDTVFSITSASATIELMDSNNGKWFRPNSGYFYQVVQIGDSTEYARSTAVAAVLPNGEIYPFQLGSVWVYSGYITDTLTGAKKSGSEFISTDSMIARVSFGGYDDVYLMLHSRFKNNIIILDTQYIRRDNVTGHYWRWSVYGFSGVEKWLDMFRFDSSGAYTVHDTTEPGPGGIPVHEVVVGRIYASESITVPLGTFNVQKGDINVSIDAGSGLVRDTVPGLTVYLSPGFGVVKNVQASFLAKGPGVFKMDRSEGMVEELQTVRIKY